MKHSSSSRESTIFVRFINCEMPSQPKGEIW